jgi:uroporphyrinogen-III decarboxylase
MSNDNKALYEERLKRINDAVNLKEPDRVPIAPMYMTFPFLYAGYTMAEVNYDVPKAKDALRKYLNYFQPDMACSYTNVFSGQMPLLDMVGIKWLQWAGQKGSMVPDRSIFQYVEKEYLEADEYPEFLSDMSGWILRKYLPRSFKTFECFEKVDFRLLMGYGFMAGTMQFANPAIAECFKVMGEAAHKYIQYSTELAEFEREIVEMGFVQEIQGVITTAFDVLSDCLRGTEGTMMDLLEQPENVIRAVETFYPGTLYGALAQAEHSNGRFVFIPLHKGMDTFLSDEQYRKFYWDTLLRLVNGLVDAGLTPWIYTEGPYNSRVECLMDVPKGKCWIHFEEADMRRVKKLLGNVACLSGGVKSPMLMFGTKEEVIAKTKENIDILAPGGGYIFDLSDTMEDCKPELVEAMFETVKTYGVYK